MNGIKKVSGLFCVPACLFALAFCYCESVPEHCSDGNRLNSETQFCFGGLAYDKCGGGEYDPTVNKCENGVLQDRCGANFYDPAAEFCSGGNTYSKCGGETYNPASDTCVSGVLLKRCGAGSYDPEAQFCAGGKVYAKCNGEAFDPANHICENNILKIKCGNNFYNPAAEFCVSGGIYAKCGGEAYDPTANKCENGVLQDRCGANFYDPAKDFCDGGNVYAKCGGKDYDPSATICENNVQKAKCGDGYYNPITEICSNGTAEPIKYTLSVSAGPAGSGVVSKEPDAEKYNAGTLVMVTAAAVNGYVFARWSGASAVTANVIQITMDGDKALTAVFEPVPPNTTTYTIKFNVNGGNGTTPSDITITAGSGITLPSGGGLTKNCCAFDGWNAKNDGTGNNYEAGSPYTPAGSITLYAKWTLNTYTVTFNSQSGSEVSSETINYGGKVTEPTAPTRANYTFGGWYREAACTNAWIFNTDAVTSDTALYAKWTPVTYTITYDLDGGSVSSTNPAGYTVETSAITLNNPTKTGHTFAGWTGTNGEAPQTSVSIASGSTGNKNYTANWTLNTYTVTFDSQSGSEVSSETINYGGKVTEPTEPTRANYTFGGWYGEAAYTNAWIFNTDTVTSDTTLYAQWTPVTYTITYDLDGGSVSSTNPADYTVETSAITLNNPTKTGHTFAGWTGTNGEAPQTSVSIASGNTGDRNYTANWTLNTYTVTFDSQDGSDVSSETINYGGKVTEPTEPTRANYTFGGWYREAACTNAWIFNTNAVTSDTTLYAKWTLNTYTVTFDSQSGSPVSSQTINHGGVAAEPTAPARANYTFDGWYKEAACTNAWNFNTNTVTSDITLYAKWLNRFTDTRDGKGYNWVKIGNQTWMAENLNYDVPNNLTDVCYNNNNANCALYGRLYNWSMAKTACPADWHLPSDAEWTTLTNFVSGDGRKLLSTSDLWDYYEYSVGTDDYGFSALPGGGVVNPGGSFGFIGQGGWWWSATASDYTEYTAWFRSINTPPYGNVNRSGGYTDTYKMSVRCVAD